MSTSVLPDPAAAKTREWLQALARIGARLAQGVHSLQLIDGVFEELKALLSVDVYLYYQAEQPRRTLRLLAYRGIEESQAEQLDGLSMPEITRESLRVWPSNQPAEASHHSLSELSASLGTTAGVHVPLISAGLCVGSILWARKQEAFSAAEVELLRTIADLIASALDRGRLRYQLNTEHARFQSLLDHLPAAVLVAEASGRIVMGNPQAERMLGHSLAPPDARAKPAPVELPLVQALAGEEPQTIDYLLRRDDGTQTWLHASGSPIRDPQGQVIGNLITCYDIDQRVRQQEALVEADRSKDKFMAFLGHELRNPLSAISYAVSLLEMDSLDADSQHSLELIRGQIAHIARLIEDLMDLARVKQGEIAIQKQELDLKEVVLRAVDSTRPLFQQRNQTLEVDLPPAALVLDADPVRLEQIVVNLLNNAAKYTESGGRVWLSLKPEGEAARLTVRDNGIGMSSETLARVFDLYVQDSAARDRSEGGLGIGLALVHALVKQHHGSVAARSEGVGHGSEFTVWLPLVANSKQRSVTNV